MANHPHRPTKETQNVVRMGAAMGMSQDKLSALLDISEPTLRKYYATELATGMDRANLAVAGSLFAKATGNGPQAVTAAIFWCKTRMQWKDTSVVEHTGKDGGPIQTQEVESARERIARRIERLAAGLPVLPQQTAQDVVETEAVGGE